MAKNSANGGDLWVFAYGSLLWNPGFETVDAVRARLTGYHRCFCMYSIHHRGTKADPGLVLALDPQEGAACEGMALRVAAAERDSVLAYLRERELVSSAYLEAWVELGLADGRKARAVAYVMDQTHEQYCGRLSLAEQARIISQAVGGRGPNTEYLFDTVEHLHAIGCPDDDLDDLASLVRSRLK